MLAAHFRFLFLDNLTCGGNDITAATMHLVRPEGTVAVSDGDIADRLQGGGASKGPACF